MRTTMVVLVAVMTAACSAQLPVPSNPLAAAESPSPLLSPSASSPVARTPTMEELIVLYEAEGLDCDAVEYDENSFFEGMAVFCAGPVGEAELLVEARYGVDDELDRPGYQLLPADYPDGVMSVSQQDLERGMRIVLRIPYPGVGAEAAEAQLIEAVNGSNCGDDRCMFPFDGGSWRLRWLGHGGWQARLTLER
jgi:hypothetical protein